MPRQPANKKATPAKKVTPPSKTQTKTKDVPEEVDSDTEGLRGLENFKTPGERIREVSRSELANWPKTCNCKFYIDSEYKQVEYTLENDDSDKVSITCKAHCMSS